ncbi:MAG: hypothetical protein ACK5LL_12620 [Suipraeoptans sp.]
MQALSKVAVAQYKNIVEDILNKEITDNQEIARIMDGMLDFYQFDEMLLLFKKLCRELYLQSPRLVQEYILYYKDMRETESIF